MTKQFYLDPSTKKALANVILSKAEFDVKRYGQSKEVVLPIQAGTLRAVSSELSVGDVETALLSFSEHPFSGINLIPESPDIKDKGDDFSLFYLKVNPDDLRKFIPQIKLENTSNKQTVLVIPISFNNKELWYGDLRYKFEKSLISPKIIEVLMLCQEPVDTKVLYKMVSAKTPEVLQDAIAAINRAVKSKLKISERLIISTSTGYAFNPKYQVSER